jgi:hypothetical protein
MSETKRTHYIEAFTYSESFESLVDRHFRGRNYHRAEDSGPYDIERIVKEHSAKLIRSRQEHSLSASGLSARLDWASTCFQWEKDVFVVIMSKGNANLRERSAYPDYRVTVTALSPERAAGELKKIRKQYLVSNDDSTGPGFFILTQARRPQRAKLEESHQLDKELLDLHYGENFAAWTEDFLAGLNSPGISILRGEPGTGKTSFLRHVMYTLSSTHRFYFVPVDAFNLLSSGSLTDFWKQEQREFPAAYKVLVLEDAETLLLERDHESHSPVAALLNVTDGLMTQFVRLHLICTLNCKMDAIDPALLRPGRLQFFRNFDRIPRQRAEILAKRLGTTLPDKGDYSLADIFSSAEFAKRTSGIVKESRPVGFSS